MQGCKHQVQAAVLAGPQLVTLWLVDLAFHWPCCWPAPVGNTMDNPEDGAVQGGTAR